MSSHIIRFIFANALVLRLETPVLCLSRVVPFLQLYCSLLLPGTLMAEVGILVVDDDVASQQALKNILDAEGWRVRVVPVASQVMAELATGSWNLVIADVGAVDLGGPLFSILKDLAQANLASAEESGVAQRKNLRVLFLVSLFAAHDARSLLEREGLPYAVKPYHLHEFLEKVSELLVDAGAIAEPMRRNAFGGKKAKDRRVFRESGRGVMFASRKDYQMTEEEIADFEREEETDRKKRSQKNGEHH
jgi:DNA-binding response OmpR family regulator